MVEIGVDARIVEEGNLAQIRYTASGSGGLRADDRSSTSVIVTMDLNDDPDQVVLETFSLLHFMQDFDETSNHATKALTLPLGDSVTAMIKDARKLLEATIIEEVPTRPTEDSIGPIGDLTVESIDEAMNALLELRSAIDG